LETDGSISRLPSIKESLEESWSLLTILLYTDSQENLADLRDASGFAISDLLEFPLKVSRNPESKGRVFSCWHRGHCKKKLISLPIVAIDTSTFHMYAYV
jgi:hypothetical protein